MNNNSALVESALATLAVTAAPKNQSNQLCKTCSDSVLFLRQKYSDAAEFVATAAPFNVAEFRKRNGVETLSQCVAASRTTLMDAVKAWNDELPAITLLKIYLVGLNKSLNIHKMEAWQIDDCVDLLMPMIKDMSVFEIHEFFCRCKTAQYGEYYGSLDVLKISSDLRAFHKDLTEARQYIQRKRRQHRQLLEQQKREQEHRRRIASGDLYKPNIEAIVGPPPEEMPAQEPKHNIISTRLKEMGIL